MCAEPRMRDQIPGRQLLLRIVGGQRRKLSRRFAAGESKTSTSFCRASSSKKTETTREKTNLNGRIRFISRNASKSGMREGKADISLFSMAITTSENEGDVMLEKTSTRASRASPLRPRGIERSLKCRDRRTSSRDRSKLERDDSGARAICHQFGFASNSILKDLPIASTGKNRSVSKVSEHAFKRTGAESATLRRSISWNRRPPHEVMRFFQVSTSRNEEITNRPRSFGGETGTSSGSGVEVAGGRKNPRISISSRFEKRERKWESCRGVHRGANNAIDRSVGENCPKYRSASGIKLKMSSLSSWSF